MSEIAEGLGTGIEGGLAARAVEPAHTSAPGPDAAGTPGTCLNCGTALIGEHCHACGQKADLHRSLGALGHDLIHGVLHLDGKFWNTLPLLVLKPGELTRRYIAGERARFVSPMAMFLFSVFAMFAVFQMVGVSGLDQLTVQDEASQARSDEVVERMREEAGRELAQTKARAAALPVGDPQRVELERDIAVLEVAHDRIGTDASDVFAGASEISLEGMNDGWLRKTLEKWRSNPSLMLYKLQTNSYKFSWLLIPLSVPFLWLLFAWKRRFHAYDHAIFVTYSLSFMTLLFIALSLLFAAGVATPVPALLLMIVPPIHIYKQLRGAYSLTRFSAAWRMVVLGVFITIVLSLFLNVLLLLGAL